MYEEGIELGLDKKHRNEIIARKIYLSFPTNVFVGKEELQFEITNSIANQFKVPLTAIQIVGSAKTGYSYHKNKEFQPGESDLDISIVSKDLFTNYAETVLVETKGFKDLSSFARNRDGKSNFDSYKTYINKGIFRPDLMPSCDAKNKWFNFFNKLSEKHFELFGSINAGIYLSQKFFEFKQADNIEFYKKI
ncbi:hypothetical protein [Tenacibaculum finnmarkense]|uniref:hypothetical protein n=1 Tax=Tenacibaculum finnmarkense TaxID=2781243 RepID=UPI001EFB753E|nr:hypothetical protein [Tenacibaculum finnmarkense]MCG8208375.1 hypothetical protein [Tenacibaculum finnmarkense genomovar finnmarkense]MCG8724340.1 hypothetical protein [Tenacibaculum finnmarkense]MCG8742678.1 hypothetical protein [Tenacibaculum finnmarkense]MCG8766054.1 hypothetical protein [Tenacibaculum finnmarkense]MCG8779025.1 hypothetical protein [Tenacibaculum finnmarkense]